jgi:hypothetical protein
MKQRRQPVLSTPGNKPQQVTGKTAPTPLDEAALKQVAGGLRPVATATPNGTWGTPNGTWATPNGTW